MNIYKDNMNKKEKDEKENWAMDPQAYYLLQHLRDRAEKQHDKIYHFPATEPTPLLEIQKTIKRFHKK